jgi:histidine ammonia-lyase
MTNLSQKKGKRMSNKVVLTGKDLTLEQVYAVVFEHVRVTLANEARSGIEASRALIERCVASDAAVYGVNTGFGRMASTRISRVEICELQTNLVRSHACGIGAPLSEAETRAMLLLRANALAKVAAVCGRSLSKRFVRFSTVVFIRLFLRRVRSEPRATWHRWHIWPRW